MQRIIENDVLVIPFHFITYITIKNFTFWHSLQNFSVFWILTAALKCKKACARRCISASKSKLKCKNLCVCSGKLMQLTKLILNTSWNQRTVKVQMIVCEIQETNFNICFLFNRNLLKEDSGVLLHRNFNSILKRDHLKISL